MSIITVVSEGDAEETDAPKRADMKKKKAKKELRIIMVTVY